MRYEEHRPPAALAPFVECLWLARDDAPPSRRESSDAPEAALLEAVVPDGCIEWIFHLASPYRRIHAGGASEVQPASVVAGVTTQPLRLAPTGRVATLGVRFRPGDAYPFLRLPLEELTDAIVPAGVLWGGAGRRLEEEVGNARDADEAREVVENSLMRRLDPRAADPRLRAAVGRILRRRGRVRLPEVAAEACWSPRQLEREFRRRVGVSPKTLARIARFQNVLRLSGRSPERAWAEIAAAAGYADQAHLIRDFREFSGTTPSRREEAEGDLSRNFVSPERLDAAGLARVARNRSRGCRIRSRRGRGLRLESAHEKEVSMLRRALGFAPALLCALTATLSAADAAPAWMAGSWSGVADGLEMEELWSPAKGGSMLGLHRDVRQGRTESFEFLRIEVAPDGVTYWASPKGRPATPFRMVASESTGTRVVFANPDHAYPARILYWLSTDGQLHARVEGTLNGKAASEEWSWRKAR